MHTHLHGIRFRLLCSLVCAVLGLAWSSAARAQAVVDLSTLIKEAKPSVAYIELYVKGKKISSGSGFVINEEGLIGTNYHVIEGAKEIKVSFPSHEKLKGKAFKAKGFVGFVKTKDLALIKIDPPKDAELRPMPMAKERPSQGETVVAIGAPLGLSDTVTNGIVSSVRSGDDLRKLLKRGDVDSYKDHLGYDTEATWIQTTAPISGGNSGGPLINIRGEVVGINTFQNQMGQNLNFAICIQHMKKFIDKAGMNVQSFANLPPPRKRRIHDKFGDAKKTLAFWKDINRARNTLDDELDRCERRMKRLPPVDPRNPMKGRNIRNRIISRYFKDMGEAYAEYASQISGLDKDGVDPDLIGLAVGDTVVVKKVSETCDEVASSMTTGAAVNPLDWRATMRNFKNALSAIDTKREVLRVNLGLKYDKTFPTQADTAEEDKKAAQEKPKKDDRSSEPSGDESKPETDVRSQMRTWTDSTGKYRVRAKCLGVEDGFIKLQKPDGTVLRVPIGKLCEDDKRFLEATE